MKTLQFLGFVFSYLLLSGCYPCVDGPVLIEEEDINNDTIVKIDKEVVILIDASHDGGAWWYPQAGTFSPDLDHQGQAFACHLRNMGFTVDELQRGTVITSSLLSKYDKVIRAGKYSSYTADELLAYQEYLDKPTTLLLIGEYLRTGEKDELAEQIGIPFIGMARGMVNTFAQHTITKDILPFNYIAGSVLLNAESNKDIEVLAWLPDDTLVEYSNGRIAGTDNARPKSVAVMGVYHHPKSKIFFIGDLNCLEEMPQPFVDNLLHWAFE